MPPEDDIAQVELTAKELVIARAAAKLAVKEMTDEFYKGVGRTVVQRMLIVIGAAAVGFGIAKGWISIPVDK